MLHLLATSFSTLLRLLEQHVYLAASFLCVFFLAGRPARHHFVLFAVLGLPDAARLDYLLYVSRLKQFGFHFDRVLSFHVLWM